MPRRGPLGQVEKNISGSVYNIVPGSLLLGLRLKKTLFVRGKPFEKWGNLLIDLRKLVLMAEKAEEKGELWIVLLGSIFRAYFPAESDFPRNFPIM
jgi:hypothetical protein